VGYWATQPEWTCLEIRKAGASYLMAVSATTWQRVHLVAGRLQVGDGYYVEWQNGQLMWLCVNPTTGSVGTAVPLKRLTRQQYQLVLLRIFVATSDQWAEILGGALHTWAVQHHGEYPPALAVAPDSAFARMIAEGFFMRGGRRTPPHGWPVNPFSHQPMRQGTTPGDFTYATKNGVSYTLVLHLPGGKTFSVPHPQ
jgi:hypothetical protein